MSVALTARRLGTLMSWARQGVFTAGAQAAVQVLGFISGIIVIRSLPPEQYAYYTIAYTALGVLTVLTDSGIGNAVLARGGQVWQDRARLGAVLATGLALRRQLAIFVLAVCLPLTALMLRKQDAPWGEALLITASILPLFAATVTGQLLEAVPRLHQQLLPLQRIQIIANLARAAVILPILMRWPFAAAALAVAAAPQWWANLRLRRLADRQTDWRVAPDPTTRGQLLAQIRRTMPAAIYYAISGQLTIWLASIFGAASTVAAAGALGRLAMIMSVLSSAFSILVVPRFARIPAADQSLILRRYWQSQGMFAAACALPIMALALFPEPALALLGPHYAGLAREAVLMAVCTAVGMMSGVAYVLGTARGVVAPPWVMLPYCIVGQIALILLIPLDSLAGVIWIGVLSTASQWLLHTAYFLRTARRRLSLRRNNPLLP